MRQFCPICDNELNNGFCFSCGYDHSEDFLTFRTCAPVPQAAARRFLRIIGTEGRSAFAPAPEEKRAGKEAVIVDSGKASRDLTWTLDDAGTMTVSGTGDMTDFSPYHVPLWYREKGMIRKIVVQSGVSGIGTYAFSGCVALTEVVLPERMKRIGRGAFSGCASLRGITLPEGITQIGESTFSGCEQIESVRVPEGVTLIDRWAFSGCTRLKSITIPESLESLDIDVFSGCSELNEVFYGGNSETYLKKRTAWLVRGNGALTTASWHFAGERSASAPMPEEKKAEEKVVIVDSGKAGDKLVWKRDQTGTLTISGSGAMNDYLFCGPWGSGLYLTRVVVEPGVTSIGQLAFSGCTSLKEVVLPEGLKTIGQEAFSGCRSLTWLTLRKGLTSIGTSAFSRCSALTDVSLPEGMTRIGKNAFYGCESLKKVTLEKGVGEIDESAFALCTSLTGVSLPEGLTGIGEGAFNRCRSLVSVALPEGVTELRGFAFSGCDDLRDVYYAGSESGRKAEAANWSRTGNDAFFNAAWHYAKQ